VCNGVACAGEMPGMGGIGTGASFQNNVSALAGYRLNLKTVHDVSEPVLACKILGMDLSMPVIGALCRRQAEHGRGGDGGGVAAAVVNGCTRPGRSA
jgi:isopentenyl diphosphate isomerase/L-lactate dehydrogenase-like FMN-dependent dehydrogenase